MTFNRSEIGRIIAEGVSILFHPLFMPPLGAFIILNAGISQMAIDNRATMAIMVMISLFTIGLPICVVPVFKYMKMIGSYKITERHERTWPYVVTFIFYLAAYLYIRRYPVEPLLTLFLFSCALSLLWVICITLVSKISLHMVGIGGIAGLLHAIGLIYRIDLSLYLNGALLLAGVIGTARILLYEHTPRQVYAGFILGFLNMFVLIRFMS